MKISIRQLLDDYGCETIDELLQDEEINGMNGVAVAVCSEGCLVEPDGVCPHGCPSILIKLGFC